MNINIFILQIGCVNCVLCMFLVECREDVFMEAIKPNDTHHLFETVIDVFVLHVYVCVHLYVCSCVHVCSPSVIIVCICTFVYVCAFVCMCV